LGLGRGWEREGGSCCVCKGVCGEMGVRSVLCLSDNKDVCNREKRWVRGGKNVGMWEHNGWRVAVGDEN